MTLAQWGSILGICVYGVLFLEVKDGKEYLGGPAAPTGGVRGRTVFDGMREWYWGQVAELRGTRDGGRPHEVEKMEGGRQEG